MTGEEAAKYEDTESGGGGARGSSLPPEDDIPARSPSESDADNEGMTNKWYWNARPRSRPVEYLRAYWSWPWYRNAMTNELGFVILFAVLSVIAPEYIFRMTIHERPIPYQNWTSSDFLFGGPNSTAAASTEVLVSNRLVQTAGMIFDLSVANALVERETVPAWLSALIATVVPTVGMVLGGFFLGPKYDAHSIWCVTCVANGSAAFYVQLFKLYVGYLRPNFFMKCGYDISQESLQVDGGRGTLTGEELTRLANGECATEEARVSFPSGHSTFAFVGCTLVCLYLLGKVALYADFGPAFSVSSPTSSDPKAGPTGKDVAHRSADATYRAHGVRTYPIWKKVAAVFSMSPMLLATWIATSRLVDNYHHPADIVAGAVLGMICALFAHALWYPGVFSPWAGVPSMLLHDSLN